MRVLVNGAGGHMGSILRRLVEEGNQGTELAAAVESVGATEGTLHSLEDFHGEADCIIDFSHPAGTKVLVDYAVKKGLPLIVATTGQEEAEIAMIHEAAKHIPVFFAHNMAVAAILVGELCKTVAAAFPDADIEILDYHHNRKVDVPSGTALIIANAIKEVRPNATYNIGRPENGKRTKEEIGIHSLRLGNVVGTHEIIFDTGTQMITIKHEAKDRAMFAEGAITAAVFLVKQKPGLYTMKDLVASV